MKKGFPYIVIAILVAVIIWLTKCSEETIDNIIKLILYRSNHKIKHFIELKGTTKERIAKMIETIFG